MKLSLIKRIFLFFIISFIVLFTARAIYDFNTFQDTDITSNYNIYYPSEKIGSFEVKNYASQRVEYNAAGSASVLDQKYERIASIVSKTVDYDNDLARFQEVLEANKAVVQMEDSRGLPGSRRVDLVIGVRPDSFDQMREAVLTIGRIISSTATIVDKTYEYRQMIAEKETLERRRKSYEELKTRGGSISELLQLEDKIIEVDIMIQQQLVGLGEYSDDNALCTINFSLYEGSVASISRKLWNALLWSVAVYAAFIGIILFVGFVSFILASIWLYLKKALATQVAGENPLSQEKEKE